MRTVLIVVGLLLLASTGCSSADEPARFSGTVTEVQGQELIVEPDPEEAIRASGSVVSITSPENKKFQTGDRVVVTHEGEIMESYPLQIRLLSIEKDN